MNALVLFDLDGTLVDSRQDLADSASDMLAAYGAPAVSAGAIAEMVGDGAAMLVRRALASAGVEVDPREALARFLEHYEERLLGHTKPYEGVVSLLERLAGRTGLAILTNKPELHTHRLLDGLHLAQYFAWVVGGDSPYGRKPDPAGLTHVREAAGVSAARTMHVGDSIVDVRTAERAGVAVCLAAWGYGGARGDLDDATPDFVAADITDLGRVIDRWLGGRKP